MTSALLSARVSGSFSTIYKQAFLTRLLQRMNEEPGTWTYINFQGGAPAYKLTNHIDNFPAQYLYRWCDLPLGRRYVPEHIDLVKPYLKAIRAVNNRAEIDDYGFPKDFYLPGDADLVARHLRGGDRAFFFESRSENSYLMNFAYGKDKRVQVLADDVDDESVLKHVTPPLTRRGIVHFDLGDSPTYREQLQIRNQLLSSLKRWPDGVHVVSYPIKKGKLPWTILRILASLGTVNAFNAAVFADYGYMLTKYAQGFAALDHGKQLPKKLTALQAKNLLFQAEAAALQAYATDPHMLPNHLPQTLKDMKPDAEWEGVGIAFVNAPHGMDYDALNLATAVKQILGLPASAPTQRVAPLHAPAIHEFGTSHKNFNMVEPGPLLPEHYRDLSFTRLNTAFMDTYQQLLPFFDYVSPTKPPQNLEDAFDLEESKVLVDPLLTKRDPIAKGMTKAQRRKLRAKLQQNYMAINSVPDPTFVFQRTTPDEFMYDEDRLDQIAEFMGTNQEAVPALDGSHNDRNWALRQKFEEMTGKPASAVRRPSLLEEIGEEPSTNGDKQ